ncbi:unnamed protein product [Brassica rapa subsp. narinosa]
MEQLRKLIIKSCGVEEIEIGRVSYDTFLIKPTLKNLSSVIITACDGLKDLTWLLFVPKLTHLKLQSLDEKIGVERCPTLRKLPLSSGSCLGGDELVISYSDDEWIERVQWEEKATEERFLLCCEKVWSFP